MLPIERATPRSAYIHVPFCAHRCGYCNFTLVAGRDDLIGGYLAAVDQELSLLRIPRDVDTLYLGGGTPTQLAPPQLDRLLSSVLHWHPLSADGEFTVEANPADLSLERMEVFDRHGVNRFSLGAQSFNPRKLIALERNHSREDIFHAAERVRAARADLAIDLIFAAPQESLCDWQHDLEEALRLAPDHVSTYGLTFEKGTSFWSRREKGLLSETNEDMQRVMYAEAIDTLTGAGFEHYEVSNFAPPGHRSRHNQVYWSGAAYYAAGPGAARYLDGRRETNHRSTTTWIRRVLVGQSPVAEIDELPPEGRARELLVIGLRRLDGVHRGAFRDCTGFELDDIAGGPIARFVVAGLLTDDGECVRLTRDGLFVSDVLWPEFV